MSHFLIKAAVASLHNVILDIMLDSRRQSTLLNEKDYSDRRSVVRSLTVASVRLIR